MMNLFICYCCCFVWIRCNPRKGYKLLWARFILWNTTRRFSQYICFWIPNNPFTSQPVVSYSRNSFDIQTLWEECVRICAKTFRKWKTKISWQKFALNRRKWGSKLAYFTFTHSFFFVNRRRWFYSSLVLVNMSTTLKPVGSSMEGLENSIRYLVKVTIALSVILLFFFVVQAVSVLFQLYRRFTQKVYSLLFF